MKASRGGPETGNGFVGFSKFLFLKWYRESSGFTGEDGGI